MLCARSLRCRLDGGASFGAPEQIDPDHAGNQFNPRLAATAGGRVDVAYLWDPAGTGVVSATTASAAPPLPGATTEAWGNPVTVQAIGTSTAPGIGAPRHRDRQRDQPAAGDRRGLHGHVIGHPGRARGRPAPRHDRAGHRQLTPRCRCPRTHRRSCHVTALDADGDPLTWSVGAQPENPGSSVTANSARGDFTYKAANKVGKRFLRRDRDRRRARARSAREDQRQGRQRSAQDHMFVGARHQEHAPRDLGLRLRQRSQPRSRHDGPRRGRGRERRARRGSLVFRAHDQQHRWRLVHAARIGWRQQHPAAAATGTGDDRHPPGQVHAGHARLGQDAHDCEWCFPAPRRQRGRPGGKASGNHLEFRRQDADRARHEGRSPLPRAAGSTPSLRWSTIRRRRR